MRSTQLLTLTLTLAALVPTPTPATTVVEMTPAELAAASPLIVAGHCTALSSTWVGPTLVTLATYTVQETIKGPPRSEVLVALPGGIDTRRTIPVQLIVPGAPTAVVGESSLLFLTSFSQLPGSYVVTGFAQGKYTIATDPSGLMVVQRSLADLSLVDASGRSVASRDSATSYEQFKREIAASLEGATTAAH